MTYSEILKKGSFVVAGDTLNPEKYAAKIKQALIDNGYSVECVGKERASLNELEKPYDILDLCIHPVKGLKLLEEAEVKPSFVLIQPGAGSPEIEAYLSESGIAHRDGCILKALAGEEG